jgi:hypothetical protein
MLHAFWKVLASQYDNWAFEELFLAIQFNCLAFSLQFSNFVSNEILKCMHIMHLICSPQEVIIVMLTSILFRKLAREQDVANMTNAS